MVASPLPDRDRRHLLQFHIARKMDYRVRLAWAANFLVIGLAMQFFWPFQSVGWLLCVSLPFLLAGNLLLLVRGYNLRPQAALKRRGEWEKTTRDRFTKMSELEAEVKKWDESCTDLTCVTGTVCLVLLAVGVLIVAALLSASTESRFWAPVFVADAVILFLPHWITGTRRGWRPLALRQQIDALLVALRTVDTFTKPSCQIQPMFEMAGSGERRVPVNARAFIRFPDGPEDFLGVQFQVALNDVQGTKYPYLYAVLVAKKQFGLVKKYLAPMRSELRTSQEPAKTGFMKFLSGAKQDALVVESSRESDVEVIVLRQKTTKTSGYHTEPAAIRRIAEAAWTGADHIVSHSPSRVTASESIR